MNTDNDQLPDDDDNGFSDGILYNADPQGLDPNKFVGDSEEAQALIDAALRGMATQQVVATGELFPGFLG